MTAEKSLTPLQFQQQQGKWHIKTIESIEKELSTSITNGLTSEEVNHRITTYGYNEISSDSGPKWIKVLLRQLLDLMNWIFLGLGVAAYVLNDYVTGSLLVFLAVFNLYLSFSQEYAAEQTLAALRNLSSPTASVIRDGKEQSIPSRVSIIFFIKKIILYIIILLIAFIL